ncbi:hypothetical protein PV646_02960 [Streptomyces sp. ID05-26A]|nr:hypothetical protein [Streptomyces sp. ID05-26A]
MDVSVDPRSEYRAAQTRLDELAGQLDAAEPGSSAQVAAYNEVSRAVKELARLRGELPAKLRARDIAHHEPRTRSLAAAGVLAGVGVIAAVVFGSTSAALLLLLAPPLAGSLLLVVRPVSWGTATPEDHYMTALFALVATLGCLAVALLTAWLLILAIPAAVMATVGWTDMVGLISLPATTNSSTAKGAQRV